MSGKEGLKIKPQFDRFQSIRYEGEGAPPDNAYIVKLGGRPEIAELDAILEGGKSELDKKNSTVLIVDLNGNKPLDTMLLLKNIKRVYSVFSKIKDIVVLMDNEKHSDNALSQAVLANLPKLTNINIAEDNVESCLRVLRNSSSKAHIAHLVEEYLVSEGKYKRDANPVWAPTVINYMTEFYGTE